MRFLSSSLGLRYMSAEETLLVRTVISYRLADDLIRTLYEGAIASVVGRGRSQTQLSSARARAAAIAGERVGIEDEIAVLVGALPSTFSIPRADAMPTLPAVTPGLPSDLVERRPDVAEAERKLNAANARRSEENTSELL